jgi:hypothetical protein
MRWVRGGRRRVLRGRWSEETGCGGRREGQCRDIDLCDLAEVFKEYKFFFKSFVCLGTCDSCQVIHSAMQSKLRRIGLIGRPDDFKTNNNV